MKFAEELVFDVLEKRAYLSPSMIRSTGLCRWYIVRKGTELFEVEAYDSESYGNEILTDYLKSLNALPAGNELIRKPVEVVAERKVTCIVRKFHSGEPLFSYFIRPGGLPDEEACVKIKGFEKMHRYLESNKLDNFAPVSIMLFMCDDGKTFIDALKCGPWVKTFDKLTLISNYLNPELKWEKQINFFRNSFALKVLTGNPGGEKTEGQKSKALEAFIQGAAADKNSFKENLSALERKYRPRAKGFFLKAALVTAVFILPLVAYFIRQLQSDASWMGAAYAAAKEKEEKVQDRDEFAFEPDEAVKILISHEFLQRSLKIKEQMLAGNFKNALDEITELSSINLRQGEVEILNELKAVYPERRKEDFNKAVLRSRTLLTEARYEEASLILQDIVDRYQKGQDAEQAALTLKRIKSLKESSVQKEKERLAKKSADLARDKVMITKLEALQNGTLKSPVMDLHGLNQQIDLIRIECVTEAAKYLANCYIKMNSAEKRLYEQLLNIETDGQKEQRLALFKSAVKALDGFELYEISALGVDYKDAAGGGRLKFSDIEAETMYALFKETAKIDVEREAYYLYLYCLKYGLQKEAALEFKKIKGAELIKDAGSLRDIKQARSDLFATKE